MQLPIFKNDDQPFQLMQTRWASILNPILAGPLSQSNILANVSLINGVNVIDHKLGRKLQGWWIVRQNAAAQIYDNQANNLMSDKTLVLTSNAAVTVNLVVF
jgi:hypothetical protein